MSAHEQSGTETSNGLTAADFRDIDRLLRRLQAQAGSNHGKLTDLARAVLEERQRRTKFLSKAIFGEPAWDMLLHLYTSAENGVVIGRLVKLVAEPKTTILRWADYLEEKGLVSRRTDSRDRRLVWLEITERGRTLLDTYFRSAVFDKSPADLGA